MILGSHSSIISYSGALKEMETFLTFAGRTSKFRKNRIFSPPFSSMFFSFVSLDQKDSISSYPHLLCRFRMSSPINPSVLNVHSPTFNWDFFLAFVSFSSFIPSARRLRRRTHATSLPSSLYSLVPNIPPPPPTPFEFSFFFVYGKRIELCYQLSPSFLSLFLCHLATERTRRPSPITTPLFVKILSTEPYY